jgi:putative acetyltransferase
LRAVLKLQSAPSETARQLTNELDADLQGEGYDPCQHHGYTLEKLFVPDLHFYVASVDGAAAGCGGVQFLDGFAELKRMYVRPAFRGTDVATSMIRKLESDAASKGLRIVRLETGDKQIAALRFYAREGYRICPAFPPYTELDPFTIATSVFMEKKLG